MTQAVVALHEKLGGAAAVEAVVGAFCKRLLADDELRSLFAKTDMGVRVRQQIEFLSMALGGPSEYMSRSISDAPKGMGITEYHFGLMTGHLVATLMDAGVDQEEIDALVALVSPLKDEIIMD